MRLCAHHQEKQLYLCDIWYLLFCMDDCLVCTREPSIQNNRLWMTVWYAEWNENPTLHTRQPSTHHNKYQMSHKYSCFYWWWLHSRTNHVQKTNIRTEKSCAPSWLYLQECMVKKHKPSRVYPDQSHYLPKRVGNKQYMKTYCAGVLRTFRHYLIAPIWNILKTNTG